MDILYTIILVVIVLVSILVALLTLIKVKGKTPFKIFFSIARGGLFFIFFYIPLIEQKRIMDVLAIKIFAAIILVAGLVLVSVGSRRLMTTDLNGVKGIPDSIIKEGIYGIIRHPVNLGLMLLFAGWYLLFPGLYAILFAIFLIAVLILETFWEERNLIRKFGDEYREYKKRVGMFFPRKNKS